MLAGLGSTHALERPEDAVMIRDLHRRLERLEASGQPAPRKRIVWWNEGEPKPKAEPGEQLTIISWMWPDEEPTEPPRTAWREAP